MEIGDRLKQARLAAKFTQEELAEKLQVTRQTISSWENHRSYPDISSIVQLSEIYDISLDILLKEDKKVVKNLKEATDLTGETKKISLVLGGGLLAFGILYVIQAWFEIPKIENILINSLFLVAIAVGLIYQLVKNVKFEKVIEGTTSNRQLAKIITVVMYIGFLFILFPIINLLITVEWQIMLARIVIIVVLMIPAILIFKKLG